MLFTCLDITFLEEYLFSEICYVFKSGKQLLVFLNRDHKIILSAARSLNIRKTQLRQALAFLTIFRMLIHTAERVLPPGNVRVISESTCPAKLCFCTSSHPCYLFIQTSEPSGCTRASQESPSFPWWNFQRLGSKLGDALSINSITI